MSLHGLSCRYAKFEMQVHEVARARTCYERGLEAMGEDANTVSTATAVGLWDAAGSGLELLHQHKYCSFSCLQCALSFCKHGLLVILVDMVPVLCCRGACVSCCAMLHPASGVCRRSSSCVLPSLRRL